MCNNLLSFVKLAQHKSTQFPLSVGYFHLIPLHYPPLPSPQQTPEPRESVHDSSPGLRRFLRTAAFKLIYLRFNGWPLTTLLYAVRTERIYRFNLQLANKSRPVNYKTTPLKLLMEPSLYFSAFSVLMLLARF